MHDWTLACEKAKWKSNQPIYRKDAKTTYKMRQFYELIGNWQGFY